MKESLQTALSAMAQSWWQKRGLMARVLYPLACLSRLVINHRQRPAAKAKAWKCHVPVLVIGNIYVGGTGKTPVVIACAKALGSMGWKPGIVSRGYGVDIGPAPRVTGSTGKGMSSVVADPSLFGDEPALIALESGCPIAVHPRRRLAIESLLTAHPEVNVIISDDGLQHVEMGRDVEILVQDSRGVGNGWLLPAGPLREPVARMGEVDAIITRTASLPAPLDISLHTSRPRRINMVLESTRFRQVTTGRTLSLPDMQAFATGKSVGAAAGIGVPQRFFDTLLANGMQLDWVRPLPDHAQMDDRTFADATSDLIFITTKDAIKCRLLKDERLWAMEVKARFDDDGFLPWLDQQLRDAAAKKIR